MLYPFTCQTILNMSQKQNSTAQIRSAFHRSIYAQVLYINGTTPKWINSVFGPGLSGNMASQKRECPVLPAMGRTHTCGNHHILDTLILNPNYTHLLLTLRKILPNYPAKTGHFQ